MKMSVTMKIETIRLASESQQAPGKMLTAIMRWSSYTVAALDESAEVFSETLEGAGVSKPLDPDDEDSEDSEADDLVIVPLRCV